MFTTLPRLINCSMGRRNAYGEMPDTRVLRNDQNMKDVKWIGLSRCDLGSALNCRHPIRYPTQRSRKRVYGQKVEHCFHRIKCQFGYDKVRYRGLAKNSNRLYLLAGFTNLLRAEPSISASLVSQQLFE